MGRVALNQPRAGPAAVMPLPQGSAIVGERVWKVESSLQATLCARLQHYCRIHRMSRKGDEMSPNVLRHCSPTDETFNQIPFPLRSGGGTVEPPPLLLGPTAPDLHCLSLP